MASLRTPGIAGSIDQITGEAIPRAGLDGAVPSLGNMPATAGQDPTSGFPNEQTARLDTPSTVGEATSAPDSRSGESPRERASLPNPFPVSAPRTSGPPSPEAQMGGQMGADGSMAMPGGDTAAPNAGGATPEMPMSPTPIAAGPPQTFTPMRAPAPEQMVTPGSQGLFGSAGGLLGGGIGIPGGSKGDLSNNSDLLTMLMMLAGKGQ